MLDVRKKGPNEMNISSVIGPGTVVNGDINSSSSIRIEGEVIGKINSKETVVINDNGKVKAEIRASQVIVSGEVQGNIFATERLEITASGKVMGDITAPRVSIAEGVVFEGKCTMKPPTTTPNSSQPNK
ncbi:MAG TPA: polymer-forming cytoskeletal protein [Candidatus Hydrogenedens sp.]|nr:polymer-forming cytoskeletal protein [Candidatus Hydrogenedens sp.]HOK08464.1 polymer-forming cytoskeletal protein [Candidatus Hydrogenedens sp.]HOL20271.1 polymer-forming cytoskeletal protein [Candidatus Hydrogenedens sp.]HPP58123.1 polymer-forming cytoskeletal protein [Candidatus Hydrogenedens sp.]